MRVSRCRSGREGELPRTVPQRRNLSSSKPRILPAFAVANLFAATILRFGNKTLKLRCQFVIFIISNKCTGVKFYLWDAFIYIHFPVLCGLPVSAEKKNAVCQLRPQRPHAAFQGAGWERMPPLLEKSHTAAHRGRGFSGEQRFHY